MSQGKDNKKRNPVYPQKDKCKVILGEELIKQVQALHGTVDRNTEWSGILLYKVAEGDINDLENLVINADSLIVMDIGTSGYTEYDFDPEDESFDLYCDAMSNGYKLGHIHTHHNMKTGFSGVDMGELHDNAPKHDFYLSLIVNYKHHENWSAKIAVSGKETIKGTISKTGYFKQEGVITHTHSWKGVSGSQTEEKKVDKAEDKDHTETITIDEERDVLFIVDTNLSLSIEAAKWEDRIKDLSKNKGRVTQFNGYNSQYSGELFRNRVQVTTPQTSLFEEESSGNTLTNHDVAKLPNDIFVPGKCKQLLGKLISLDPKWDGELVNEILNFNNCIEADPYYEIEWMNAAGDIFEPLVLAEFDIMKVTPTIMHCIAYSLSDLITSYEGTEAYNIIDRELDCYMLPDSWFSFDIDKEVLRLTGLMLVPVED